MTAQSPLPTAKTKSPPTLAKKPLRIATKHLPQCATTHEKEAVPNALRPIVANTAMPPPGNSCTP